MKNRQFGLMVGSIAFGITCLIGAGIFIKTTKDLSEKVETLEQEVTQYKWELEQIDQMICIKEDL